MSLLTKTEFEPLINSGSKEQIFVSPILEASQIGAVSFDLRLGYDFLVSVQTQKPSIALLGGTEFADSHLFFKNSRRDLGDVFTIHPSQTVLTTTLEYVGLPENIYADIVSRSSYSRLGISVNSMFQPGFRGCISLELFNHSNIPIELVVGCRLVQARFYRISNDEKYMHSEPRRKYIGNVRPTVSKAAEDKDLKTLNALALR